jgi:trigger factor
MQSQVSEIDPVTVEVQVQVPWDRVRKGMDETFTKLQRTARVKGFRPGKAPRSVLQKLFSKDVQAEVVSTLVEESLIAAVKEHEIPVVSNAQMSERPEISDGQPLSFKVKFEVRPKVESLNAKLALTRDPSIVTDADVDQEIQRLREQHAIVRPIEEERPAKKGDVLVVDYEVSIEGEKGLEKKPEMKGEARTIQLGEGRLLDELDQGLEGAKVGETRTITVTRPDGDANAELAGKKVVFEVAVKEMRERILPDLDDEFAKDVGEYGTLLELRLKVRERLEASAKQRAEGQLREQVVEKLVEANPIMVPPSLVDQQLRAMLGEYFQIMKMIGQKPDMGELGFEEMKKRAEQKVRAALLLGELSRQASIGVESGEVDAKLREIAEKTGKHVAKVRADHAGEKREALETQILEDKLIKHLLDQATITNGTAPASAASTSASESASSMAVSQKE